MEYNDFYEVEKIIGKKMIKGTPHYLIKWWGYPLEESTWEPLENLENVQHMIKIYEITKEKKKYQGDDFMGLLSSKKNQPHVFKSPESPESLIPGSLEYDIPEQILSAKMCSMNEVICCVEWRRRYDGSKPTNSVIKAVELRKNYPYLLLDFYESRIKASKPE